MTNLEKLAQQKNNQITIDSTSNLFNNVGSTQPSTTDTTNPLISLGGLASKFAGDIKNKAQDIVFGLAEKSPLVKTVANIQAGQPLSQAFSSAYSNQEKNVNIAVEKRKLYEEALAQGKSETQARLLANSKLTPTQQEDVQNLVLGTLGDSGEIKSLISGLKEAKTAKETYSLLKNAGIEDDIAKQYAPKFAELTDKKAIQEGLDALKKTAESTVGKSVALNATDSLAQEAKKYKSAEEFVDKNIMNIARERDKQVLSKFGLSESSTKADFNKIIVNEQNRLTEKYGGILGENVPPKDNYLSDLESLRNRIVYGKYIPQSESQLTEIWKKANIENELPSVQSIGKTETKATKNLAERKALPHTIQSEIPQQISRAEIEQTVNQSIKQGLAYANDITKLTKSQVLNLERLDITPEAKNLLEKTIEDIRPLLEQKTGKVLTNKEMVDFADKSSKVLSKTIGRDETLQWEASMFNVRKRMAQAAESGVVTKQLLDDMAVIKTQGQDIARKLQSLSKTAIPEDKLFMNTILEAVTKSGADADEILKASKGVDFNDFNQASKFYRQFISPKLGEWIDLLRYNSMLSSPLTHIKNITSNLAQSLIVAPIEKATLGSIDFFTSKITGNERKYFSKEALAYLEGYTKNVNKAFNNLTDVLRGKKPSTQLDIRSIPVAIGGTKGKIAETLGYPMKLLEGMDQFFTALTMGGEEASLAFRSAKGVPVKNALQQAREKAAYRLFRQPLFPEGQGAILNAVDSLTNLILMARNSNSEIVSQIAKLSVPFVQTPMNIFKQGIEYSPLGFTTTIGAKNIEEQFAKALIGSSVMTGAGLALVSGRLTGQEPINESSKQLWRQANKQPYSIKVGNNWYSYQNLPPVFSFPLSMLAILKDLQDNKKIDDTYTSLFLTGMSKQLQFLSDQSYAKSIGDLLSGLQGGEGSLERLISNYPQQLIPFRALTGWMARLADSTQRKIDNQASFVEKQIQLLELNYPGLSQLVPARLDVEGKPIENANRFWNALSPVQAKEENKKFALFLENKTEFDKAQAEEQAQQDKLKERIKPIYDNVMSLLEQGKEDEATAITTSLTPEEYAMYKKIKSSEKTKLTSQAQVNMYPIYKQVQDLLKQGRIEDATALTNSLSPDDYRIYKLLKNKFQSTY